MSHRKYECVCCNLGSSNRAGQHFLIKRSAKNYPKRTGRGTFAQLPHGFGLGFTADLPWLNVYLITFKLFRVLSKPCLWTVSQKDMQIYFILSGMHILVIRCVNGLIPLKDFMYCMDQTKKLKTTSDKLHLRFFFADQQNSSCPEIIFSWFMESAWSHIWIWLEGSYPHWKQCFISVIWIAVAKLVGIADQCMFRWVSCLPRSILAKLFNK